MADSTPGWVQTVGALGGVSVITGFLTWATNHRSSKATAKKAEAEAEQIEENKGASFEQAINDRITAGIDSWEKQVAHLVSLVETLSKQNETSLARIATLEEEVRRLRIALDKTTRELHAARVAASKSAKSTEATA
ncbi:hypothetical protein [Rhodoblastus sp.]|uniref:hypothetical protein n=1 Tax=Rhodoblastus sp. TaxID=1962975 RepID=UPI00261F8D30|nr:hypothetical protein [Rhodoblastus sp.]